MSELLKTVEKAIRETLKDPDGAGSDIHYLDEGPGDEWLFIEGNLDVRHLASHVIDVLAVERLTALEARLREKIEGKEKALSEIRDDMVMCEENDWDEGLERLDREEGSVLSQLVVLKSILGT